MTSTARAYSPSGFVVGFAFEHGVIDCPDTHATFMAAADASGLGDLVRRIEAGYCDQTPGGGRRWIVHYPETVEWRDETLARRPGGDSEPTIKTLIELPTFAILAPSHGPTHLSGRP